MTQSFTRIARIGANDSGRSAHGFAPIRAIRINLSRRIRVHSRHSRALLPSPCPRHDNPCRRCYVSRSMSDKPHKLRIAGREFQSRLLLGTGKFASNEAMAAALDASGTELVTVALRRADLSGRGDEFA